MSIIANVNAQWWKPQHHYYDTVEYVVMYELTFREDTAHLDCYRTENHMLSIGKKRDVSSFRGYGTYRHNMELKKAGDSGLTEELIKTGRIGKVFSDVPSSAIRCSIFKNMTSKNITTIDHIYMQGMYEYEESFNAFNWQITAETDTINNYVCQKAICDFGGRTWEAWFTSELPFSDGPYKFCNLLNIFMIVIKLGNYRCTHQYISMYVAKFGYIFKNTFLRIYIRYCSDNAVFGMPEVSLGITPGFGGTQRLARAISVSKAKEMLFTGKSVKADEAYRIGLVNCVYPQAELMAGAMKLAETIARNAPIAVRQCKKAVNEGLDVDLEAGLSLESKLFGDCFETQDQREGMSAFLEKRKGVQFVNG